MNNPLGSRLGAEGDANAGGAGAGAHSARRTPVTGAASVAARDEAHARRPSAGTAVIADWRCGFRGGPSERIAPAVVEPTGSAGSERRRMTSISVNEFSTIAIARPGSAAIFASASIAILAADTMSLKAAAARWWAGIISRVIDCSAPSQPVGGSTRRRDQGRTAGTEADAA